MTITKSQSHRSIRERPGPGARLLRQHLGLREAPGRAYGPNARWIEVAPAGAETVLVPFTPPGLEDRLGTFSGVVFECDDIRTTYEELRDRGVEFTEEPTLQSWGGIQAQFKDQDGNGFVLVQE